MSLRCAEAAQALPSMLVLPRLAPLLLLVVQARRSPAPDGRSPLGLAGLRHTDALEAAAAEAQQLVALSRRQSGTGLVAEALASANAAAALLRPVVRRAGYSWAGSAALGEAGDGFGQAAGLLWVEAMVEVCSDSLAPSPPYRASFSPRPPLADSSGCLRWARVGRQVGASARTTEQHRLAAKAYSAVLRLLESAVPHRARDRAGRPIQMEARAPPRAAGPARVARPAVAAW
eukprot:SAG11_NODE_2649_length_3126_cov_9.746614_5_plen_232_part_00